MRPPDGGSPHGSIDTVAVGYGAWRLRCPHRLPLFALFGARLTTLVATRWAEGGDVRVRGGASFGPRTGILMRADGAVVPGPADEGGRRRGLRLAAPTQPSIPPSVERTR